MRIGRVPLLKYNEPQPEVRKPLVVQRFYAFKGDEQVGVCTHLLPLLRRGAFAPFQRVSVWLCIDLLAKVRTS